LRHEPAYQEVAMKVPDELIKTGVDTGWPQADKYRPDFEGNFRKALEAVLPKVRERLLDNADLDYADEDLVEIAFDHAFPEEGS
jgi:hypothetical protein